MPQDDGLHTYIAAKYLLYNAAGSPYAVYGIATDITPLKKVDEMRETIISHVSHELRTPLFHIKGFASTLLQTDVEWDEETRLDFIRSIDQEADRLTRLVSDLLDMSRLESGRTILTLEPVDLPSVARAAIERTAPSLREHRVRTRIPRGLPMALVDRSKVEQVLENLLENASKYSPAGTSITLTARSEDGVIRVGVRDHGIGVPERERECIFEKFVRLEQDRDVRFPGTGLGLSICEAIVAAHGGRIWVEGAPREGSVFYFTLPESDGSEAEAIHRVVKL